MADLDMEKLAALEAAATPPPWRVCGDEIVQTAHVTRDVWVIPHREEDIPLVLALRNGARELLAGRRERDEARRLVSEYFLEHQLDAGGTCECETCGRVRVARAAAAALAKEPAGG